MTAPVYALNELLRNGVKSVQNRVFPPGIKQSAMMPRITVTPMTPTERRIGIGEGFSAYKGLWLIYTFRVDVWDKNPSQIEKTSDEVMYTIWKHRDFVSSNSANAAMGNFLLLEVKGGGAVTLNQAYQIYQRTLNISGIWLSKSAETW